MNWQNYIMADPFVQEGKACFKGTQIMLSVIFDQLAAGATYDDILKSYPTLSPEAISAAIAFVADITRDEIFNRSKLASQREVMVSGKLEAIKLSDYTFTLITAETQCTINGYAKAVDSQVLSTLLGKNVVVSGTAHFTQEGTVLILEATHIVLATGNDLVMWGRMPVPFRRPFDMIDYQAEPGISAIYGKWPGDESDEEVLKALEELS